MNDFVAQTSDKNTAVDLKAAIFLLPGLLSDMKAYSDHLRVERDEFEFLKKQRYEESTINTSESLSSTSSPLPPSTPESDRSAAS